MTPAAADADREEGAPPGGSSRLQTLILVGVGAVALAAAGIAVWWKVSNRGGGPDLGAPTAGFRNKDLNLAYSAPPGGTWERDEDLRVRLGSPYFVVFRRADPEACVAIGGRAFGAAAPRPRALKEGLTDALAKLLERDTRRQFAEGLDRGWFGQEAGGFKFAGVLRGGGAVEGEALAVAHKGVAYWFLAWAPADAYPGLKDAFAAARRGCKLLEPRPDRGDAAPPLVPYKNNVVGYSILDPEGIWKEVTDEDDLKYEGADKLLRAALGKKKDLPREATLLVYVTPGGGDPLAEARRFVQEKRAAELKAAEKVPEFQDRAEAPEDPPLNTAPRHAEVVRFKSTVKGARGQDRLHAVSAAKAGDKLVVVHAWCDWADRDEFEGAFVEVVGSLAVR
jgi:hypothetical protein